MSLMTHGQRNALHEFRSAPVVTGRVLLLEYAVTAWIPVVCVSEVLMTPQPVDEIFQLLFVAAMAVFILQWLTRSWLEFRLYGESVCRLSALPVARATAFQAEIECNLPLDGPAPVVVRLESRTALSKFPRRYWRVEQRIDPRELRRLGAKRVIVPVELTIPQRIGAAARSGPAWTLTIERRCAGMNFFAEFVMPVIGASEEAASAPVMQ
jgi:hypothetical protein